MQRRRIGFNYNFTGRGSLNKAMTETVEALRSHIAFHKDVSAFPSTPIVSPLSFPYASNSLLGVRIDD